MERAAKHFCNRLKIEYSDEFLKFYIKGKRLFEEKGSAIIDTERLKRLNDKYNFFRRWFNDVLLAAELVAKDRDLLLFTYVLYCIIEENSPLHKMKMPDRAEMATDFAPLFSLLFCVEDMVRKMEKRGLPFEIISDTLQGFDAEINDYFDMFGRSGMRIYVEWFMLFVKLKLIRIGRLNFEMMNFPEKVRVYRKGDDIRILIDGQYMHKKGMVFGSNGQDNEEDKFYADIEIKENSVIGYPVNKYGECETEKIELCGYDEILRKGDKVLNVHIPAHEPFTYELCRESYAKAREIFEKFYPEYEYKAFCCFSWMLEMRLCDIIKKKSNIIDFASDYIAFPLLNDGKEVYTFLYHLEKPIPIDELPENSSMQSAVKEYLKAGNVFYQKGGIILK